MWPKLGLLRSGKRASRVGNGASNLYQTVAPVETVHKTNLVPREKSGEVVAPSSASFNSTIIKRGEAFNRSDKLSQLGIA